MANFDQPATLVADGLAVIQMISPDNKSINIQFSELEVALATTVDSKVQAVGVQSKSASLYIPLTDNETETRLRLNIRGSLVLKSQNVQALVLVQAGTISTLLDPSTLIDPKVDNAGFGKELETTIPPNCDCCLTLVALIQRNTRDDDAVSTLGLDGVDIEIVELVQI